MTDQQQRGEETSVELVLDHLKRIRAFDFTGYKRATLDRRIRKRMGTVGVATPRLEALCQGHCGFIREGFADRRYQDDAKLIPRTQPDAFVLGIKEAVVQADWLLRKRGIATLCVHGDNPQAVEFVRSLRQAFTERGLAVRAFA